MIKEDAQVFLRELGVAFQFGKEASTGILDAPGQDVMFSGVGVGSQAWALTYATDLGMAEGDTFELLEDAPMAPTGTRFRVSKSDPLDDGLLSRASLAKLEAVKPDG